METFFMNTRNSKTNEPNRFKYDLIDKLDLKNPNKNMTLANLSIYYTWKNVKSTYNNNKFKISAPTWNETFDLPDGSYNISDIQDYIEYIIKKHAFEKDFFKLMNNSVFGKTMENVRKYRDIKLVKTDKKRNKLVSEPNFYTMKLIDENLAIIDMKKVKVKINKPIYLGMIILDLSKISMYDFWYDYIKVKYGEKASLCYTDTDSLIVKFKTEDFYKDISEDVNKKFDTSNFVHNRPLPIGVNKKVLGVVKDELAGGIIKEFVALKPKAYSYKTEDGIELKKANGTKKCIIDKMLSFEDYKNCLLNNGKVLRSQQRFRSEDHNVYTENINKIALNCDDDKRFVAKNGIENYPYGHVLKKE